MSTGQDGINAALHQITETLKAFAQGIVELQERQNRTQEQLAHTQEQLNRVDRQVALLTTSQKNIIDTQQIMLDSIGRLTQRFDQFIIVVEEMQSEIRGLQTENRRILEQLQKLDNEN